MVGLLYHMVFGFHGQESSLVNSLGPVGEFFDYQLLEHDVMPWYRWPIEIDGLPNLNMVDLSMAMLNNQMVTMFRYV